MKAWTRQQNILRLLSARRFEKTENLAREFEVSRRTIQSDISTLSISYPIYTLCGRHAGGVYVGEKFKFGEGMISDKQLIFLREKLEEMTDTDKAIMEEIINILVGKSR